MKVDRASFAVDSAEYKRLTGGAAGERVPSGCSLIPCPGGCGGHALLEPPMAVSRAGVVTSIAVARCRGECREEYLRRGKVATRLRRFELDAGAESFTKPIPTKENFPVSSSLRSERSQVQARINTDGITLLALATDVSINPTKLMQWLTNGKGLTSPEEARLLDWAGEPSAAPPPPDPEPIGSKREDEPLFRESGAELPKSALEITEVEPEICGALAPTSATPEQRDASTMRYAEERAVVAEALRTRGLKQSELARQFKVNTSGICTWLRYGRGLRAAKVEELVAWAEASPEASVQPTAESGHDSGQMEHDAAQTDDAPARTLRQAVAALGVLPLSNDLPLGDLEVPAPARDVGASCDVADPHKKPCSQKPEVSPYEAVLRSLLEQVAQRHLEDVAGDLASGVVVRVSLEWRSSAAAN